MIKYELAIVESDRIVQCTNKSELEILLERLKTDLPSFGRRTTDMESDEFGISIRGNKNSYELGWWLVKWFLDRGWEPFSN
jgi:hypothetical protein